MEEPTGGNSTTAVAEPGTGQSVTPDVGTSNSNGQAASGAQSAPVTDSFTDVDPQTLPPELQTKYKSMLADYTRKTQSIADVRKKAEAYDQISRDQRFVDYWQGLTRTQKADFKDQKQEVEKKLGEKITDEEFAKGFQSKDDFLSLLERVVQDRSEKSQKKIEHLEQQLSVKDAGDVVESFATQVDKTTGEPVRPDFYALDEDQLITGFLTINQPDNQTEQAYMSRLNEAYSWAKTVTQKYYDKGKTDALARIQTKAAQSTEMPTQAAKGVYTGPDPKKLSVHDAMDLAKRRIKIPQVYD
jgi:hypothetical protein